MKKPPGLHLDPAQSHWWRTIRSSIEAENLKVVPEIFPAGTDSRYLRAAGIPSFGISCLQGQPILLHDHNERISIQVFEKGIDIMARLIKNLINDEEEK